MGKQWLSRHNPVIDWRKDDVKSENCDCLKDEKNVEKVGFPKQLAKDYAEEGLAGETGDYNDFENEFQTNIAILNQYFQKNYINICNMHPLEFRGWMDDIVASYDC